MIDSAVEEADTDEDRHTSSLRDQFRRSSTVKASGTDKDVDGNV